jgi:hypothetical protein
MTGRSCPCMAMVFALLASATPLTGAMAQARSPCSEGWFTIRARVVMVEPASVVLHAIQGASRREVSLGALLCSGETLEVPSDSNVEVLEAGRTIKVSPRGHQVGASPAVRAAASAYVDGVLQIVQGLRPALPRALPTASRGRSAPESNYRRVRLISGLRDTPRQRLMADAQPVLAWRSGVEPYRCSVTSEDATRLWLTPPTAAGSCNLSLLQTRATRVGVYDGYGYTAGINISIVDSSMIPLPPWGAGDTTAERTAWAIWLWREGQPEWRLQAISMLNALADAEPIAANLLERIFDENLPFNR